MPDRDSLLSSIRRHLDGLKATRDGTVLYNLIERGLKRYGETGQIERAFVNFVSALLGRYAKDTKYDSATRIKARLIQQRLALHVASSNPSTQAPSVAAAKKPADAAPEKNAPALVKKEEAPPLEPNIDVLEQELVERVADSISFGDAHGISAPGDIDNAFAEFVNLKGVLVKGLDELIQERHALLRRIEGAAGYLKALESDRKRLTDELNKARKHSSVDDLTGLPKRDIFVRNLEAEVGRVRRYGFSFAFALIDVDGMEEINKSYGQSAGDAVLRCYATEILSHFRAYDFVARYGDDEFAVLFPNTQKEGAMRALEKARKSAASTYVSHEGRSIRLPTFSSVLTIYAQGEKPAQLLKRASEALDNARIKGPDQMVVSLSN